MEGPDGLLSNGCSHAVPDHDGQHVAGEARTIVLGRSQPARRDLDMLHLSSRAAPPETPSLHPKPMPAVALWIFFGFLTLGFAAYTFRGPCYRTVLGSGVEVLYLPESPERNALKWSMSWEV